MQEPVRQPVHREPPAARLPGTNAGRHAAGSQRGAALIVGLVLLLAITVIGVSGMNASTLELNMAGNMQAQEAAFQAAEAGIDIAMARGMYSADEPRTLEWTALGDGVSRTRSVTSCVATTPVPDIAFSTGTGTGMLQAWHFDVVAEGEQTNRNARASHRQGFYVVGPATGGC